MANKNEKLIPSYRNIAGTTCSSYRIGPKGVALASKAVLVSTSGLEKYQQRLVVVDANKEEHQVVYDSEIPLKNVRELSISSDASGKKTVNISLKDGTSISLSDTVKADVVESDLADGDKLLLIDSSGNLKNANLGIVKSTAFPTLPADYTSADVTAYLEALSALEAAATDTEIPTFKAVTSYVGSITDILGKRMDGNLPYDSE